MDKTSRQRAFLLRACRLAVLISWQYLWLNEKRSEVQTKINKKTNTIVVRKGQGKTSRKRAIRLRACRLAVLISWH